MKTCLRCRIYGRVQGVYYRASARARARALGVGGHARNRSDGTVEVLACGERAAVDALREWLWRGPAHAQVQAVECREEPYREHDDFR